MGGRSGTPRVLPERKGCPTRRCNDKPENRHEPEGNLPGARDRSALSNRPRGHCVRRRWPIILRNAEQMARPRKIPHTPSLNRTPASCKLAAASDRGGRFFPNLKLQQPLCEAGHLPFVKSRPAEPARLIFFDWGPITTQILSEQLHRDSDGRTSMVRSQVSTNCGQPVTGSAVCRNP